MIYYPGAPCMHICAVLQRLKHTAFTAVNAERQMQTGLQSASKEAADFKGSHRKDKLCIALRHMR